MSKEEYWILKRLKTKLTPSDSCWFTCIFRPIGGHTAIGDTTPRSNVTSMFEGCIAQVRLHLCTRGDTFYKSQSRLWLCSMLAADRDMLAKCVNAHEHRLVEGNPWRLLCFTHRSELTHTGIVGSQKNFINDNYPLNIFVHILHGLPDSKVQWCNFESSYQHSTSSVVSCCDRSKIAKCNLIVQQPFLKTVQLLLYLYSCGHRM